MTRQSKDSIWKIIGSVVALVTIACAGLNWFVSTRVLAETPHIMDTVRSEICNIATTRVESMGRQIQIEEIEKRVDKIEIALEKLTSNQSILESIERNQEALMREIQKGNRP